ncbi:hypothetical protein [Wolbachia endosymbiont of Folsomia candida]|uniref:hypothetical protein n=1 Tax=Wolbachia endosymbiont of Folsomia candida TaxID=169402 RepID=UPI000B1F5AAD|nr:hypothetical protein [Wolbachia endosymbiont of Folsomia candida]APR98038.1 hypothetical protein ASM33_01825 [Wolbachia endosymbiont of Folsomia candida]
MVQVKNCTSDKSIAEIKCQKEVACTMLQGSECDKVRKECEKIVLNQFREGCERKVEEKYQRMEKDIEKECNDKINVTPCEVWCSWLQEGCYSKLKTERKHDAQKKEEMKCENTQSLKLANEGKLHIKEALDKFYPYLTKDITNKVIDGTYLAKQFGVNVNHLDNGVSEFGAITWAGNIDKSCFKISDSNPGGTESYKIDHDSSDATVACHNQIFKNDSHIQITKVVQNDPTIDKSKPVVTISQNQPLILVNAENDKVIKIDGTETNTTYETCKQFFDDNNRITDCTDKGEDCSACKESIWDFTGEIYVYTEDYSALNI